MQARAETNAAGMETGRRNARRKGPTEKIAEIQSETSEKQAAKARKTDG